MLDDQFEATVNEGLNIMRSNEQGGMLPLLRKEPFREQEIYFLYDDNCKVKFVSNGERPRFSEHFIGRYTVVYSPTKGFKITEPIGMDRSGQLDENERQTALRVIEEIAKRFNAES